MRERKRRKDEDHGKESFVALFWSYIDADVDEHGAYRGEVNMYACVSFGGGSVELNILLVGNNCSRNETRIANWTETLTVRFGGLKSRLKRRSVKRCLFVSLCYA